MKREARDFREKMPRPVQRIMLDENSTGRRVILVAAALCVAAAAFWFAFHRLTTVDAGWAEIEADAAGGTSAAQDFRLEMELGREGKDPLSERKLITSVYTNAAREAWQLYNVAEEQTNIRNLWWINHHPNEETEVDPRLYGALKKAASAGRCLYLGPVYEMTDAVAFSTTDTEAAAADARLDEASGTYLREVLALILDEQAVSLSFPADNTVCLHLSDACIAYGKENDIQRWLDFGWQKNAYIADDLAAALQERGLTHGVLSSADGFIRCLDEGHSYDLDIIAWHDGALSQAAIARYTGPAAVISLTPLPGGKRPYAYRYQDGTLRSAWISPADGLDHIPVESLTAACREEGCADLLNRWLPLLFSSGRTDEMPETKDAVILCRDGKTETNGNSLLRLVWP